jgi:thiol-disulfide isomerase/thioredoxin
MLERLLIALLLAALGVAAFRAYTGWQRRRASRYTSRLNRPAVLYFRSDQCAPCVTQGRFLQQIAERYGDRLQIEKIDADVESERAQQYGVITLPTTLVVDRRGLVRHANYGLADAGKLTRQLETLIAG